MKLKNIFKTRRNNIVRFYPDVAMPPEVTPIKIRPSPSTKIRFNLCVPSINREHFFGGVATAVRFFDYILSTFESEHDRRIILTDKCPNYDDLNRFSEYTYLQIDDEFYVYSKSIVSISDRYGKSLEVRCSDVFVTTAWWTSFVFERVRKKQIEIFGKAYKEVYLIQDFEPNFYPWSIRYAFADSTYKKQGFLGVCNSGFLYDYFVSKAYQFDALYFFNPRINPELERYQKELTEKKEKIILFYGRPSVDRNLFTIGVESLKLWARQYERSNEWKVISIGEYHENIDLTPALKMESVGKLDLLGYAKLLKKSSIGLSLMLSPHPSYPPLEMSLFHLKTITNNYDKKNFKDFHPMLTAVDEITPERISDEIIRSCQKKLSNPDSINHATFFNRDSIEFDLDVKEILRKIFDS